MSELEKKKIRKKFVIRLIIGSVMGGIFVCSDLIFTSNGIQLKGILCSLYWAVAFGVLFYLISRFVIFKKIWEKK